MAKRMGFWPFDYEAHWRILRVFQQKKRRQRRRFSFL
jgi:hypothetical protein